MKIVHLSLYISEEPRYISYMETEEPTQTTRSNTPYKSRTNKMDFLTASIATIMIATALHFINQFAVFTDRKLNLVKLSTDRVTIQSAINEPTEEPTQPMTTDPIDTITDEEPTIQEPIIQTEEFTITTIEIETTEDDQELADMTTYHPAMIITDVLTVKEKKAKSPTVKELKVLARSIKGSSKMNKAQLLKALNMN